MLQIGLTKSVNTWIYRKSSPAKDFKKLAELKRLLQDDAELGKVDTHLQSHNPIRVGPCSGNNSISTHPFLGTHAHVDKKQSNQILVGGIGRPGPAMAAADPRGPQANLNNLAQKATKGMRGRRDGRVGARNFRHNA